MNEKEIAEIRRRYRPDKNNITSIRGCYVNEKREIVSEFNQSLALMPQEEAESMLAILKRTLSGTQDKNLINITFSTNQVVDSDEHRLLMSLRNSSLNDGAVTKAFFERVIEASPLTGDYLILMAFDKYDVPYRSKDGLKLEDSSTDLFTYILCSICPVKVTKPALSYYLSENEFHTNKTDWIVGAPELGFMFPSFDDRSSNIYNALYYSRDTGENHSEFVDTIFKTDVPMPAAAQKETFEAMLANTLGEDCSYAVVQTVHDRICDIIETHKVNKETEPLVVSKSTVKDLLQSCGVSDTRVTAFDEKYDAEFGADADLSPRNIIDAKQFELRTPDVTIHVNPERSDLVQTRIINGARYILIRADEGVELNGVNIHIG